MLVKETHRKRQKLRVNGIYFSESDEAFEIRKYLLTYQDPRGYTLLHTAAEIGDKYFTTMIIYEAKELGVLDNIINMENNKNLTPLYLLCQTGFRNITIEEYTLPKWTY